MAIPGLAEGLSNVGGSLLNSIANGIISGKNLKLQKEFNAQQQKNWETQFNYQKELNNQLMQREDTAIQRSVADYESQGFNKLLAIGNPSEAGTLTSTQNTAGGSAASVDFQADSPVEAYLKARQMQANTQLTEEQAKLTKERANSENALTTLRGTMKGFYDQLTAKTKNEALDAAVDYLRNWHDYQIDQKMGTKSNETPNVTNGWSAGFWSYRMLLQRNGVSVNDLIDYLKQKGMTGLRDWFVEEGAHKGAEDIDAKDLPLGNTKDNVHNEYPMP